MVDRTPPVDADLDELEQVLARLLRVGTYVAVTFLAVGSVLLLVAGRSPLEATATLDLGRLPTDLAALRPEGFLGVGLVAVIATPAARVGASVVGYLRNGERPMALVSIAILGVIAVSIVLGFGTEG